MNNNKMGNILGFLMDFKSNAGKAFSDVRKAIVKTTTDWAKSAKVGKSFIKGFSADLQTARANFRDWAYDIHQRTPSISSVIDQIGEKFGGVAGIIADTLARPGAALAALSSIATRTAMAVEKSMVRTRRETEITAAEWDKFKEVILNTSIALKAPVAQLSSLTHKFAAANLPLSSYNRLMEVAVSMNRLTGRTTEELGDELVRMTRRLGMSADGISDFYNALQGYAKNSPAAMATLSSQVDSMIEMVRDTMPKNFQKGMEDSALILASTADMFGDNIGFLSTLLASGFDPRRPEYVQMRRLALAAGSDVAAQFDEGMESKDLASSFEQVLKGIRSLADGKSMTELARLGSVLKEVFGVSVKDIDALSKITPEILSATKAAGRLNKEQNGILGSSKDLLSTSERWWHVWSLIEASLLPFGEALLIILTPILSLFETILTPVAKFVNSLTDGGKVAMLFVGALVTAKYWFGPLNTLAGLFTKHIIDANKALMAKGLLLKEGVATVAAGNVQLGLAGMLTKTWAGATGVLSAMLGGLRAIIIGIKVLLVEVLLPVMLLIGIFEVVDQLIKKVFGNNQGIVYYFGKALEWVGKLLGGIADIIGGIIGFFTGDLKTPNISKETKTTWFLEDLMGGGASPSMADSAVLPVSVESSQPLAQSVYGDSPVRNWRREFGTDDLVSAIYETNDRLVKQIAAGNGSPTQPGLGIAGQREHTRINYTSPGGPR